MKSLQAPKAIPLPELDRDTFRWKTKDGIDMRLEEMETKHIYHSMKMVFNHLANLYSAETVRFEFHYGKFNKWAQNQPHYCAALIIFFIHEIERRGDLPAVHWSDYRRILEIIYDCKIKHFAYLGEDLQSLSMISERLLRLPAAKVDSSGG